MHVCVGANINVVNKKGDTPLMVASANGHLDIVARILINEGTVDLNAGNAERDTALMMACRYEHTHERMWVCVFQC